MIGFRNYFQTVRLNLVVSSGFLAVIFFIKVFEEVVLGHLKLLKNQTG